MSNIKTKTKNININRKKLTDAVCRIENINTSYNVPSRKYSIEINVYNDLVRSDVNFSGTKLELHNRDIELKSKANEIFNNEKKRHDKEKSNMILLFREDLSIIYNTYNNSKEPLLWDKAWEFGHSDGLYSVNNYYSDLVSLIE